MGLHDDCRCIYCKTALMVRLLMQLPQSMFGIRSNAVVLFKQHTTAEAWHAISFRTTARYFPLSMSCCLSINWVSLKVPKCCPRFPLRRQNKDNEATWSTPRTTPVHVNIFFREKEFADFTLLRSHFYNSPHTRGGVIFLYDFCCVVWPTGVLCISMAAADVGASVCDC